MVKGAALNSSGVLGIDAGGTYTDLVFLVKENVDCRARVKVPTLPWDVAKTIEKGIKQITQKVQPECIQAINLATTFATNAIVENRLRPAGLLLIGYDRALVERALAENRLGTPYVEVVSGGHDPSGNEILPLDVEEVTAACRRLVDSVEAMAISGYFSVRNPSHEICAGEILNRLAPCLPVTCGHELASDLDAFKRGATAALNAGLIPVVVDLLDAVDKVKKRLGLNVPLSVVRGDGSLVTADWARLHPVEMILSGPAASAVGGHVLGGRDQGTVGQVTWIVDMGGTTTDIISLGDRGRPRVRETGASVGGHRTLVKAIDIRTIGLGGDSRVRFGENEELLVGPRRVHSLCMSAEATCGVVDVLERLEQDRTEPLIVCLVRQFAPSCEFERQVLDFLKKGPQAMISLLESRAHAWMGRQRLDDLENRGYIRYIGFTPTDALHVLGDLSLWDAEASRLGARILSRGRGIDDLSLCRKVCRKVSEEVAVNVFQKCMTDEGFRDLENSQADHFLHVAMDVERRGPRIRLELGGRMVGAGAPARAFLGEAGRFLSADTLLSEDTPVTGAVGAATGSFFIEHVVKIFPRKNGGIRAHLPEAVWDSEDLEEAVAKVRESMEPWMVKRAGKAGLTNPVISIEREDQHAMVNGKTRKIYLGTQLRFCADEASFPIKEVVECP